MKKGLIVLCIILLFVPTYISVIYYFSTKETPVVSRHVDSVEVTAPDGKTLSSDDDSSLITLFTDISNNRKAATLPKSIDADNYFSVTYSSYGQKTTLKFYFTENPSECYFLDSDDVCYRVDATCASTFISKSISESVYKTAIPPVLMVAGETIEPQTLVWKYKPYGVGDYVDSTYSVSGGYSITDVGSVSSKFSYSFDIAPTSISVVVNDAQNVSNVLYSGDFDGIRDSLSVEESLSVDITFNVSWDEEAYRGSATYVVSGTIFAPATFTVSSDRVKPGEFVVIRGKNILDMRSLTFSSSPSISFVPTFTDLGDGNAIAIVPINIELGNADKQYVFTVATSDTNTEFTLNVEKRETTASSVKRVSGIGTDDIGAIDLSTNPYPNIYANIKSEIATATDFSKLYYTGNFDYGFDTTYRRFSFGDYVYYTSYSTDKDFLCYDSMFAGQGNLTACADGKVVYVGSQAYTGGLVVVDHGYGIMTWYCNLGKVSVSSGMTVKKGDTIGTNRDGTGLVWKYNGKTSSCHIAATVFGVPIDIAPLIEKGIPELQ